MMRFLFCKDKDTFPIGEKYFEKNNHEGEKAYS